MDALTRERLDELLDRVLLWAGSNKFEVATYESTGRISVTAEVDGRYAREIASLSEVGEMVGRILEATDE